MTDLSRQRPPDPGQTLDGSDVPPRMRPYLAEAAAVLAIVGSLWAGSWALDARYARAADVEQKIGDVKLLYLQSERRAVARELFDLSVAKEQGGKLTPLEQQRQEELTQEYATIVEQIKALQRGTK